MGQIGQVYPPGKFVAQSAYSYPNPFGQLIGTWSGLALSSKPFITVSAVGEAETGIINGGADFGPDTPGTQTCGIQEAWDYAFSTAKPYPIEGSGNYWMKPILLLEGVFIIKQKIVLSPSIRIVNPKMIGMGTMSTYVYWDFNDNCIEIDHTNGNIRYSSIEIGYMQPQAGSNVGAGTAFFAANYVSSDPSYQTNVFQSYDLDFSNQFSGNAMLSLTGFQKIILYNPQAYSGGVYGALYTENTRYVSVLGGYMWGQPYAFYVNNVESLVIYGSNTGGAGGVLSNVDYVYIDNYDVADELQINGNVGYIHLDNVNASFNVTLLNTQSSSAVTIDKLKIDRLHVTAGTFTLLGSNLITINRILIESRDIASGATAVLPTTSIQGATTSGLVYMWFTEYEESYKKLIINLASYENDTSTNQTLNFPLPFRYNAIIVANNTGLTITASLTGITITSPNNTSQYTGIVIVEGD